MECALADADEIGHAATSMFALSHVALANIFRRDDAKAEELVNRLVALGEDKGSLYWKSYGLMLRGWLLLQAGRASEAIAVGTAAVAAIRSTGATAYAPWYMSTLAMAHAALGQFDDAWRCVGEAIGAAEQTGERWCDAEIYRTAAEIALMEPNPDQAKIEAYFDHALATARAQNATSLELRAAIGLARLLRKKGRHADACSLVTPILHRFTEGSGTLDLMEANSLVQTLG
jgi:predicted ATPase